MKISRQTGTVSEILNIFIQDSTVSTGAGLANVSASAVNFAYARNNMASTSSGVCTAGGTLGTYGVSTLTQIISTSTLGWYQFCPPDQVFASGRSVILHIFGYPNMAPVPMEIELTANTNQAILPVSVTTMSVPVGVSSASVNLGISSAPILLGVSTLSVQVGVSSYSRDAGVSTIAVAQKLVGVSTMTTPVGVSSASVNLGVSTLAVPVGVSSASVNLGVSTLAASVSSVTGSVDVSSGTWQTGVSTVSADTASTIAFRTWDEILTGVTHNIATSAGKRLRQLQGTILSFDGTVAVAPTLSTIGFVGGSGTNDFYRPGLLVVESAFGTQFARIASYDGATSTATLATNLATLPSAGDVISVLPWASVRVSEMDAPVGVSTLAVSVDVSSMNAAAVIGTGVASDLWRGA